MSEILLETYRLADQIKQSDEVQEYIKCKERMENDQEAQQLIRQFQKVKEQFEEAQRFGIYHPNYHEAKERIEAFQKQLKAHPVIGAYLEAEEKLDRLLYLISKTLAHSISPSIKVPSNFQTVRKGCGRTD